MTAKKTVNKAALLVALAAISLGVAGCDHMNNQQQRALSGGAIGAGAGAVLGVVTGLNPWVTGAIGAGAGAATGALTH